MSETPRERAEGLARKKVVSLDPYHIRNLADAYELLIKTVAELRCIHGWTVEGADKWNCDCTPCELRREGDKLLAEPKGEQG